MEGHRHRNPGLNDTDGSLDCRLLWNLSFTQSIFEFNLKMYEIGPQGSICLRTRRVRKLWAKGTRGGFVYEKVIQIDMRSCGSSFALSVIEASILVVC